jgi:hypothetical protein
VAIYSRDRRCLFPDGSEIIISNSQIVLSLIDPAAKRSGTAVSNLSLRKVTGFKAKNLTELVNIFKKVPNGVIYTHSNFCRKRYLIPEPPNDFAVWCCLFGDDIGERLM